MPEPHAIRTGQELIWDYFQNKAPESFDGSRARLQHLMKSIGRPHVVLNIGCGSGIFEKLALAEGIDIYSLDPSEKSVQKLRQTLQLGDKAKVGYIQSIPFPESHFDIVVVSEVLEHLTPEVMTQGLAEIRRVLKPGGRVLGTVPSRENLEDQIVVCPCCGKRFHRWGHEQTFEPEKLRRALCDYFVSARTSARPFIAWSALNWKGKIVSAIKFLVCILGVHGSNQHVVFEAVKPQPVVAGPG